MVREPSYCLHKSKGQAYVRLNGRMFYLGAYGSPESKRAYSKLKAEWLANRHNPKFASGPVRKQTTMSDLANAYLDFALTYYGNTNEYQNLERSLRPISELYEVTPAAEFGAIEFKACREWWLAEPTRSRQYVNKMAKYLLRVLKWGVSEGMVPPAVHETCRCIAPLKRGRTRAPESRPVKPVPQVVVDATIACCTQVVGDMIRLQQLLGCRPGELCAIKPSMVDRSRAVWTIQLEQHKNAHRGKERVIYVGPKAQSILATYLLRGSDSYCFSPKESERQRLDAKHAARRTSLSCGNRPGSNRAAIKTGNLPGDHYTTSSYDRAVDYATWKAFPAPDEIKKDKAKLKQWRKEHSWNPNQLRHGTATDLRKRFGIEAARVILGQSEIGTSRTVSPKMLAKLDAFPRAQSGKMRG